jgi:peptidoglycan/xylan/chitin deacetylase (PgdA/CDA1 family)
MRIRPAFLRRQVMTLLCRRAVPLGGSGPMVSFTFDDFPRTAGTTGAQILEAVGARGTYYAAPGLMRSSSSADDLCRTEDLHRLLESGHEVGSHTFSHVSCNAVPSPEFQAEVNRGRQALAETMGASPANFAYPFGDVTLAAKRTLGPAFGSSRSIFGGFNGPEVDLNLLLANSLYGGLGSLAHAEELIAENARRRTWLIFYTHDVHRQPSPYGCTPELLESAVSVAAESGSRILTVEAVLAEMGVALLDTEVQASTVSK